MNFSKVLAHVIDQLIQFMKILQFIFDKAGGGEQFAAG